MTNKYDFIERRFGGGGGSLFDFEIPMDLHTLKDARLFVINYLKNHPKTAYIAIFNSNTDQKVAWVGNAGGKRKTEKIIINSY